MLRLPSPSILTTTPSATAIGMEVVKLSVNVIVLLIVTLLSAIDMDGVESLPPWSFMQLYDAASEAQPKSMVLSTSPPLMVMLLPAPPIWPLAMSLPPAVLPLLSMVIEAPSLISIASVSPFNVLVVPAANVIVVEEFLPMVIGAPIDASPLSQLYPERVKWALFTPSFTTIPTFVEVAVNVKSLSDRIQKDISSIL